MDLWASRPNSRRFFGRRPISRPEIKNFTITKCFFFSILHTHTKFHASRFNNKKKYLKVVDPLNAMEDIGIPFDRNFQFYFKKGSSKKLWVGRRKETILVCVLNIDAKKNFVLKGLKEFPSYPTSCRYHQQDHCRRGSTTPAPQQVTPLFNDSNLFTNAKRNIAPKDISLACLTDRTLRG